jgi:hypothetical protein
MAASQSLGPRLASLAADHRALEAAISEEARRAAPDFVQVAALKKRKLALKDQIAALSRRTGGQGGHLSA